MLADESELIRFIQCLVGKYGSSVEISADDMIEYAVFRTKAGDPEWLTLLKNPQYQEKKWIREVRSSSPELDTRE